MPLAPGARVGPYEILALLGSGGMGEVYLARDTKLDRHVAIKVLPQSFAQDPERLARFEREARILAALNHPNIATIHGVEDDRNVRALVMELVEGPTLAERIARGPMPLAEALAIARQIADALDASHEKGIVHRDLKPANIKMTVGGSVKVLDFGLARPVGGDGGGVDVSHAPTGVGATRAGLIVGTVAYMSPEQARGELVNRQTDVWAFGCVLYEMLTGCPVFDGASTSDLIAGVLKGEPDWDRLPAGTPGPVRRLLDRCLRKDCAQRLRDIADARLEIDEARAALPEPAERFVPRHRGRVVRLVAVSALVAAAAVGGWMIRSVPTPAEARLEINTPPTTDETFAVSPDGLKVVFVAQNGVQRMLWLRLFESLQARVLPGTEGATFPFWSPDGRSIGFFAQTRLKRVNLVDGSVQSITANLPAPYGGTWNRDDAILYAGSPGMPIMRIPASGGEPAAATRFEAQQGAHEAPHFLPDGRHFLFYVSGASERRGIHLGELDTLESRRLADADGPAVYMATAHNLVFVREGKLLAQPFDPGALTLRGEAVTIDSNASTETFLSASAAGPLLYRHAPQESRQRQLVWADRSGKELDKVLYDDTAALGPALSRDGRRVAVYRFANGNMDIWSFDALRRTWDRLTFNAGDDVFPLWSADGTRIAFGSRRGSLDLYWRRLSAPPDSEQLLLSTPQAKFPMDWSLDGQFLLYDSVDPNTGVDIWALPLEGAQQPVEIVRTAFDEQHAQFSPDRRWIAYASNRTGRFEIYLRPFRESGPDVLVSAQGGSQPRWNPDGRELFYIALDGQLMAVPIPASGADHAIEPGEPRALFVTNVDITGPNNYRQQYMVSPDGRSFVMNLFPDQAVVPPLVVILNWAAPQ